MRNVLVHVHKELKCGITASGGSYYYNEIKHYTKVRSGHQFEWAEQGYQKYCLFFVFIALMETFYCVYYSTCPSVCASVLTVYEGYIITPEGGDKGPPL